MESFVVGVSLPCGDQRHAFGVRRILLMTRDIRPNRRSWERRHRISAHLREALSLAQEEAHADHEDRYTIALLMRLGLLLEDAIELEEKALERRKKYDRD